MKLNKIDEIWNSANSLFKWVSVSCSPKNLLPCTTMAKWRKDFSLLWTDFTDRLSPLFNELNCKIIMDPYCTYSQRLLYFFEVLLYMTIWACKCNCPIIFTNSIFLKHSKAWVLRKRVDYVQTKTLKAPSGNKFVSLIITYISFKFND